MALTWTRASAVSNCTTTSTSGLWPRGIHTIPPFDVSHSIAEASPRSPCLLRLINLSRTGRTYVRSCCEWRVDCDDRLSNQRRIWQLESTPTRRAKPPRWPATKRRRARSTAATCERRTLAGAAPRSSLASGSAAAPAKRTSPPAKPDARSRGASAPTPRPATAAPSALWIATGRRRRCRPSQASTLLRLHLRKPQSSSSSTSQVACSAVALLAPVMHQP